MFYRYSSAIVQIAESCHYVPDYVLCEVVKRARMSHLKIGDFVVVALPLEAVGEDAEPTPVEQVTRGGPKVKTGPKTASFRGKTAEVISFADKTPLSRRQWMQAHDRRVMYKSLSDRTSTGQWERLEAERKAETEARKTALRWERVAGGAPLDGPVTAADFRFGSLRGDRTVKPVRQAA